MTQVVEERDGVRWTHHVGTNIDAATKVRLYRHALAEMTSVSAIVRRALARELERAEKEAK